VNFFTGCKIKSGRKAKKGNKRQKKAEKGKKRRRGCREELFQQIGYRFLEYVLDTRLFEHVEDATLDIRPLVVQGAGRLVLALGQPEKAALAELGAVDRLDDLEELDGLGLARQFKTAAAAFEGEQQLVFGQILQDFGEEMLGNLQFLGDIAAQNRLFAVLGEVHHGAESVFAGLGNDHQLPRAAIKLLFSVRY